MKYVALTFDDGRSDNYLLAKCIMDKYQFKGTVYVTTGFVDGTWDGKDILQSPTRPLNVEEIIELHKSGWEIGLHGDKHQTQVDDMRIAMNKLESWGIENTYWSISVPNSDADNESIESLFASEYGNNILYVRKGRKCDTSKLLNRLLYAVYNVFKLKLAYRKFNAENIFPLEKANKKNVPSVVIKFNDTPKMISDLIKRAPEDSVVVLMLHSILPSADCLSEKNPWCWADNKFEKLCLELKILEQKGEAVIAPLARLLKG